MTDEAPATKRGGRKSATEKTEKVVEAKKRTRKEVKPANGAADEESATPAKRGRGRPAGNKKKAAPKPKSGRGRGRPKKGKKKSEDEAEDDDDVDEGDDE